MRFEVKYRNTLLEKWSLHLPLTTKKQPRWRCAGSAVYLKSSGSDLQCTGPTVCLKFGCQNCSAPEQYRVCHEYMPWNSRSHSLRGASCSEIMPWEARDRSSGCRWRKRRGGRDGCGTTPSCAGSHLSVHRRGRVRHGPGGACIPGNTR